MDIDGRSQMTPPARALLTGALILALCGCFNSSSYMPVVNAIGSNANFPGSVLTGATSASVGGTFFSPGVTVYWNGKAVPTAYRTPSSLQITLGPDQTKTAGTAEVKAANDGDLFSDPFTVTVIDAPLTATSLDPPQAAPGSGAMTVTVIGTGFTPGSQVLWNGAGLPTTFNSSTSLSVTAPASLLAVAGEGFVQVANPQCSVGPNGEFCITSTPVVSFRIGPSTKARVPGSANDMVWDATHALLFVTSTAVWAGPATVTALDPRTAAFGGSTTTPSGPVQLSISTQDVYLYVAVQNGGSMPATRLSLPGLTNPTQVPSATWVTTIAAGPDVPDMAAFTGFDGLGVLDGTAVRGQVANVFSPRSFTWGVDASTLFAIDYVSQRLLSFHVDGTGVSAPTVLSSSGLTGRLHYDRAARLLYGDAGDVFDEQGVTQAGFAVPTGQCIPAMDGAGGRMFFACAEPDFGLTLRSFDLASRQPLSRVLLQVANFHSSVSLPGRLVRFGADGLAVTSPSTNSVYLYSGAFVR
jgi:hypothetical protein